MQATDFTLRAMLFFLVVLAVLGCGEDSLIEARVEPTKQAPPRVSDDFDGETAEPEVYALVEGTYEVTLAGHDFNECNADLDYFDGRRWPIVVEGNSFAVDGSDTGGTFLNNVITGFEREVIDWNGFGWDCVQGYDYFYTGELHSNSEFTWTWQTTWTAVAGAACNDNEHHAEMPCSYRIHLNLKLVEQEE